MKDNLSIVISMILLVILIVIFPLYNHFERQDNMSYNVVLKATSNFVDEVLNTGYIDQVTYDNYINNLSTTGNIYDVQLEAHRKIFVKTSASPITNKEYEEQYLIDYNDDIFSKLSGQVLNEGFNGLQDRKLKDGSYLLNTGDKLYVKMKNSSSTMAGSIFNIIIPAAPKDRIVVNYGGIVKNNAWKKVDTAINTAEIPVFSGSGPAENEKVTEFNYTGNEQSLKIAYTGTYKLEVYGAQGGNGNGGNGGYTVGEIKLNKNDQIYIYVGGSNGYNGGGTSGLPASTGGGATDIRLGGKNLSNRIIVAGGGGGNGYHYNNNYRGGEGGGLTGGTGYDVCGSPGTGGTQTSPGVTPRPGTLGSTNAQLGIGGNGERLSRTSSGAGGGGYYGGGAGSSDYPGWNDIDDSGGGGGSSYYGTLVNSSTTAGAKSGNGLTRVTYIQK